MIPRLRYLYQLWHVQVYGLYASYLPIINPSFDQEDYEERRRESNGVQCGGGHRVRVVGPIDGLVAAEESIYMRLTNERKHFER